MNNLEHLITEKAALAHPWKPTIFDLSQSKDVATVEALFSTGTIQHVTDDFEELQRELFQINNPTLVYTPDFKDRFAAHYEMLAKRSPLWQQGVWVWYPWRSLLAHILPEQDYYAIRTARNRYLITPEEQQRFYNATVGIGGLSVGSAVAYALTLQGGPKNLRLADMDRLALSNTNRVLAGVESLGVLKVEMAARKIYEVNPYANVTIFPEGLNDESLPHFMEGLDVAIDELDTLPVKLRIREEARKRKIPVLMGADNGDNAIIDIERHDQAGDAAFFHDMLGTITVKDLTGLDKFGIGKTITKMLGAENVTTRMQQSLLEMGKTIVSWPQLGDAALLNGIGIAYAVRKVLTGQPLEPKRAFLSLDEKLDPTYSNPDEVKKRNESSKKFAGLFGL